MSARKKNYGSDLQKFLDDDSDSEYFQYKDKLLPSPSFPNLLISEDGDVFSAKTLKRLKVVKNHSYNLHGPIVTFSLRGKAKQLSLMNLVYETFVKKDKLSKNEVIWPIDDDFNRIIASNLAPADMAKFRKKHVKDSDSGYSCWLNGDSEIFI